MVVNAGSSSIKFAAFEAKTPLIKSLSGSVINIHTAPSLKVKNEKGEVITSEEFPKEYQYSDFFDLLISRITSSEHDVVAIGHRVVHGGTHYHKPVLVTQEILEDLKKLIPFAPLHQPYNINAILAIKDKFPALSQVACFDTAFHHSHPKVADFFGIPREFSKEGVRRYGFHGLSYEYIMEKLQELAPIQAKKRIVIAHLGNGASMCAVKEGKCIDSTMGFTALDGLLMGTRCGSLDPGVVLYFMQFKNMNHKDIEKLLYERSGLLGVSGVSNNMQTLLESPDPHAKEAVDLFTYRIRKELGGFTTLLGGIDVLIFTGGIGENSAPIREAVCLNMDWLNITLDPQKNKSNEAIISKSDGKVEVRVIPTDEERIVAQHTYRMLKKDNENG